MAPSHRAHSRLDRQRRGNRCTAWSARGAFVSGVAVGATPAVAGAVRVAAAVARRSWRVSARVRLRLADGVACSTVRWRPLWVLLSDRAAVAWVRDTAWSRGWDSGSRTRARVAKGWR